MVACAEMGSLLLRWAGGMSAAPSPSKQRVQTQGKEKEAAAAASGARCDTVLPEARLLSLHAHMACYIDSI